VDGCFVCGTSVSSRLQQKRAMHLPIARSPTPLQNPLCTGVRGIIMIEAKDVARSLGRLTTDPAFDIGLTGRSLVQDAQ
jgi:hypothetical protein